MQKLQNDLFANRQTKLDSRDNLQTDALLYPTRKKSFNADVSQERGIETESFLVDWQLPKEERVIAIKPGI
jgi:hypothetical protein